MPLYIKPHSPSSTSLYAINFSMESLTSFSCFFLIFPFIFLLLHSYQIYYLFTPIFNYLLRKSRFWCNCDICHAYITRSWTSDFTNISDWYTHLLRNSSSNTIHIHVLGNIVTANPENVEYILKNNFENYPKGKPFSMILGDFLGRGIFNVDGELWRFQRKIVSLELGRVSIKSYVVEVVQHEIKHRLIPILSSVSDTGHALDLQDMFRRFSFDCICKFSFGLDPKCLQVQESDLLEFEISFDLASKLSAERAMTASPITWKIKRLLNIGSEKKLKQAIKNINALAGEVIRQRRKLGFSNNSDLLSRFMCVCDDESYLRDIVVSFLLAGRDTVASTLTSFFLLIADHPEVETAILQEANQVIRENHENIVFPNNYRELHYLHAAVFESMRLYPPVQFDSKFCLQDDILADGTTVKKGTRVTYHPYAMGRMENIWGSDCMEFKPERWLKDGVFFPENPFKYPVFQAGIRICLGKEMALLEIKSVAVWILRRFHFELAQPQQTPRFSPGLTATFTGGLPVFVRKRRGTHQGDESK